MNSYDLFCQLWEKDLLKNSPHLWWPNIYTFEVVIGAILTQQTQWHKVIISLNNLRSLDLLSLENLANAPIWKLASAISPSGFYNQKAKRLHHLSLNILHKFSSFETFQENVTREWLLEQKGIGQESADAILCYACRREEMVVDTYTARLLHQDYGFDELDYSILKDWLMEGIITHYSQICILTHCEYSLNELFALFHGMIVEYSKQTHSS